MVTLLSNTVKLYVFKGTCKWWWTSRESNKRRYNNQSCQFGGKCGGAVGRAWSPCRNYCYAVVQGNLVVGCYVLLLGLVCKFSVTMWYIVELNGLLSWKLAMAIGDTCLCIWIQRYSRNCILLIMNFRLRRDFVADTWSPERSFLGGGVCGDPIMSLSEDEEGNKRNYFYLFIQKLPYMTEYMKSLPCQYLFIYLIIFIVHNSQVMWSGL